MVAARTHVLPCVETLEWIIHHTDTEKFLINNKYGECINVFFPMEVSTYYKLKDVEVRINKYFLLHSMNIITPVNYWHPGGGRTKIS
jgi:hypothetical protein